MKNILSAIGLDDGAGNISSMRVFLMLVLLAILIPKVVIAIKTSTPVTFNSDDLYVLGIVFGAKTVQTAIENKTPTPAKP